MRKVEVIDASPIFVEGLVSVLTARGFKVTAKAPSADGPSCGADLFLVDPDAVRGVAFDEFVRKATRIAPVLITTRPSVNAVARYDIPGVIGLVDRDASAEFFVRTVERAVDGCRMLDLPGSSPAAEGSPADRSHAEDSALSRREREVLRQIARGLTHNQIGTRLGISRHTVDTYVKRLRSKLNCRNKADLIRIAVLGETRPLRGTRDAGLGPAQVG